MNKILFFIVISIGLPNILFAQTVDLATKQGRASSEALFVMTKSQESRYAKSSNYLRIKQDVDLLSQEGVNKLYELGEILVIRILAPEGNKDGEVRIQFPIWYKSKKQYENALSYQGDSLSYCHSFEEGPAKGQTACLFERTSSRNDIPAFAGRVRKILVVNDQLVMTTSIGHIVVCEIHGNYERPRSELFLAKVPRRFRGDLLEQDITRIHLGRGMRVVVTGLNGQLGNSPFGSKLASFDGEYEDAFATRRNLRPLTQRWEDPLFDELNYYIRVEHDALKKGTLHDIFGLSEKASFTLHTKSLEEMKQ